MCLGLYMTSSSTIPFAESSLELELVVGETTKRLVEEKGEKGPSRRASSRGVDRPGALL